MQRFLTCSDSQRVVLMKTEILPYILESGAHYASRLEDFARRVSDYIQHNGKHARSVHQTRSVLMEGLMSAGKEDVMLDMECRVHRLDHLYEPMHQEQWAKKYHQANWMDWLKNGYYEWIGQDLKRSMNWALRLLEWTDQRMTAPTPGMVYPISTMAQIELIDAFTSPPIKPVPSKRWLEQIIRNMVTDADCLQLFRDLVGKTKRIYPNGEYKQQIGVQEFDPPSPAQELRLLEAYLAEGDVARLARWRSGKIYLLKQDALHLRSVSAKEAAMLEERKIIGLELDQYIGHRFDEIEATMGVQLRDIHERPRRLFRPHKLDFVEIDIPALSYEGLRGVIFDGEEGVFPDICIEFLLRENSPHLQRHRVSFKALLEANLSDWLPHKYASVGSLTVFLRALVVEIFHRIVVRDEDFTPHPSQYKAHAGSTRDDDVVRRAHLRKLPAQQQASEDARKHARDERLGELPQGFTFVRAVYTDEGITHNLSSRPFTVYTKTNLPAHLR